MKSTRTTPRHHRYEGPRIERPTPTSPPSVQGIWPKADILVMEKWMTMAHQSRWLNHLPTYINTVPIKTGWLVQYPFWRAKQSNITFFQGCFILYEVGKFQVSGLIIRRYMFLSQTTHFFISGKCHCPKKTRTNTHRFPVAKMRSGLGRCNDDSVLPQDTDKIIPPPVRNT